MTGSHQLDIREDRYVYTLTGAFDETCVSALKETIDAQDRSRRYVLVDLRALKRCSRSARRALVEVHRKWAHDAQRVVYLAKEGRMRGLSLWIVHMAGDEYAKAVGSDHQAETWLGDNVGRQERAYLTLKAQPPARAPVRAEKMGVGQTLAARAMVWMNRFAVGEPLEWTAEIIRVNGLGGLKKWVDTVGAAIDELSGTHGDLYAQTLFGLSAMWNGCRSCSRGHILAANILYYEATETLFPLYEGDVLGWLRMSDRDMMATVRASMREREDLSELFQLIDGYFEYRSGDLPDDAPRRALYAQLDAVWTLVNECSIVAEFEDNIRTPHMPKLYRKRAAVAAYHKARGHRV